MMDEQTAKMIAKEIKSISSNAAAGIKDFKSCRENGSCVSLHDLACIQRNTASHFISGNRDSGIACRSIIPGAELAFDWKNSRQEAMGNGSNYFMKIKRR
jgi:hypothetical protein